MGENPGKREDVLVLCWRGGAPEARRHSHISRELRRKIAGCGNKDLAFA